VFIFVLQLYFLCVKFALIPPDLKQIGEMSTVLTFTVVSEKDLSLFPDPERIQIRNSLLTGIRFGNDLVRGFGSGFEKILLDSQHCAFFKLDNRYFNELKQ